jgi:hypothetical protein
LIRLKVLAKAIVQEKEIKDTHVGKEETKFDCGIILYTGKYPMKNFPKVLQYPSITNTQIQ